MKIGIIGRGEWTFESMIQLQKKGHKITFIVTSKEAIEYKYTSLDFKNFAIFLLRGLLLVPDNNFI